MTQKQFSQHMYRIFTVLSNIFIYILYIFMLFEKLLLVKFVYYILTPWKIPNPWFLPLKDTTSIPTLRYKGDSLGAYKVSLVARCEIIFKSTQQLGVVNDPWNFESLAKFSSNLRRLRDCSIKYKIQDSKTRWI